MVGLFQTDGSHYGSTAAKGRLTIELSDRDGKLLWELQRHLPCYSSVTTRTRDTNFKKAHVSRVLSVCAQEVRTKFEAFGVPVGKKSNIIQAPSQQFSRPDYLRGIIDGDGSIGFTAKGYPFVSIVTASKLLADHICTEIESICGVRRTARRNQRDSVFNIMVANEPAAALATWCYPTGCLSIRRKYLAARDVGSWIAPTTRFGGTSKAWTAEEDAELPFLSVARAATLFGRTEQSVKMRRWRLGLSAA